jgi:hypothetical protein
MINLVRSAVLYQSQPHIERIQKHDLFMKEFNNQRPLIYSYYYSCIGPFELHWQSFRLNLVN